MHGLVVIVDPHRHAVIGQKVHFGVPVVVRFAIGHHHHRYAPFFFCGTQRAGNRTTGQAVRGNQNLMLRVVD
jgi:hypothetical protein